MKKTLLSLSIIAALGVLTACGGGGGSSTNATKKTVTGVVSAKSAARLAGGTGALAAGAGSLTVNGTTYLLDATTNISADDADATESAIAEGDVVTMEVSDDDGDGQWTASMVEYDDETQGFVLGNNLVSDGAGGFTGSLNVMGKVVQVTATTLYSMGDGSKATMDLLGAGDVVEVSGFPDANGDVIATRIEGKRADEDIEVKGVVGAITATTFDMGTLRVDFASLPADMGDVTLADGLYVEVKADAAPVWDAGASIYVLQATKVELEDGGDMDEESASEGDSMDLVGVLSVDGSGTVTLNGYTLVVGAGAHVTEGQLAALAGQLVEVEGYIEGGNLVVTEAQAL